MTFAPIVSRLKNASRYLPLAYSPIDWFSFALLGIARGRTSLLVRHLFSGRLVVRPALFNGMKLVLNPLDLAHLNVFNEIVQDNSYDLGLVPFTPDHIFDCGGHIGMFSLLARSRYPMARLTIFEPNRDNIEWIRRQVKLNALNIEVVQAAVSVRDGEATFEDRLSYSGGLVDDVISAAPEYQVWMQSDWGEQIRGASVSRYTVPIVNLPAMLLRRRPNQLLLKLDVEGEEARIIPELFDVVPQESAIFFEIHYGEAGWDWAKKQFTNHGFAVERRQTYRDFIDGFALRC